MADALTRLVAWQQGGKGRYRKWTLESTAVGIVCELREDQEFYPCVRRNLADTPEAAIDAAMVAFEEREKGRGTT